MSFSIYISALAVSDTFILANGKSIIFSLVIITKASRLVTLMLLLLTQWVKHYFPLTSQSPQLENAQYVLSI